MNKTNTIIRSLSLTLLAILLTTTISNAQQEIKPPGPYLSTYESPADVDETPENTPTNLEELPDDMTRLKELELYPYGHNLMVAYEAEGVGQVRILIVDMQGRVIGDYDYHKEDTRFEETINLPDLTPGIYIVNVQQGPQALSKKVYL